MKVEVPNQEGRDGGVEVKGKEHGHARLIINIVIECDDVQEGGPIMHIYDEEGGVAAQVMSYHQLPWEPGDEQHVLTSGEVTGLS